MKIDIKENIQSITDKMSNYPSDCVFTGEGSIETDLKIFIKQETLRKIDDYLKSDINNELGGVLIGDVCLIEGNRKFIKIDNLIIAKHTNSSLSRLTFTHETWVNINEILERDFPDKKILGWFHSHPGHTVFLSNFDVFIQENFFNMDYMVAYVYDPTIDDRGFFFWKDKKIAKSNGYYIYDILNDEDLYKTNEVHNNLDFLDDKHIDKKKTLLLGSNFNNYIILIVLLANLLLLLLMIYNYIDLKKNALLKEDLARELSEVKNENEKLKQRLENFIVDYELQKNGILSYDKNENFSSSKKTEMINKSGETNSSKNTLQKEIIKYTVKPGDSLDKIVQEFYKNKSGIEIVMKQNNLKSKTDIKIGQVLEIPRFSE